MDEKKKTPTKNFKHDTNFNNKIVVLDNYELKKKMTKVAITKNYGRKKNLTRGGKKKKK